MEPFDHITDEELEEALDWTDVKTRTAANSVDSVQNGITQSKVAEWFDFERKTIYNHPKPLEQEDIGGAI